MSNQTTQLKESHAKDSLEDLAIFCEDNDITKADLLQILYLHERLVNSMQDQRAQVAYCGFTCKVLNQHIIKPVILI